MVSDSILSFKIHSCIKKKKDLLIGFCPWKKVGKKLINLDLIVSL